MAVYEGDRRDHDWAFRLVLKMCLAQPWDDDGTVQELRCHRGCLCCIDTFVFLVPYEEGIGWHPSHCMGHVVKVKLTSEEMFTPPWKKTSFSNICKETLQIWVSILTHRSLLVTFFKIRNGKCRRPGNKAFRWIKWCVRRWGILVSVRQTTYAPWAKPPG
jgi:hypothetical protein